MVGSTIFCLNILPCQFLVKFSFLMLVKQICHFNGLSMRCILHYILVFKLQFVTWYCKCSFHSYSVKYFLLLFTKGTKLSLYVWFSFITIIYWSILCSSDIALVSVCCTILGCVELFIQSTRAYCIWTLFNLKKEICTLYW